MKEETRRAIAVSGNLSAQSGRIRRNRFTVIVVLCALCFSGVIAAETIYVVGKMRGNVPSIYVWPIFVPTLFVWIINRKSFSCIIFVLYCIAFIQATAGTWLLYTGRMLDYHTIDLTNEVISFLSTIVFVIYLTIPLFGSAKPAVLMSCLWASYFLVFLVLTGYLGKALMTGIFGSLIFSTALLAAGSVSRDRPWRAFWIANAGLALLFGGAELYAGYALNDPAATRFGGAHLWADGHITAAGVASLALDIAICTLSNLLGFYASRLFIERFKLE
ncbi:MAG TPA: hypothetical protein VEK73_00715 [Xanthobacteraceae bacterium]|nr:hypothetical protein [Xanthobacteraceae bacterium]